MSSDESDERAVERPTQRARHLRVPELLSDPTSPVHMKIRRYYLMLVVMEKVIREARSILVRSRAVDPQDLGWQFNIWDKPFPRVGQRGYFLETRPVFVGFCHVCLAIGLMGKECPNCSKGKFVRLTIDNGYDNDEGVHLCATAFVERVRDIPSFLCDDKLNIPLGIAAFSDIGLWMALVRHEYRAAWLEDYQRAWIDYRADYTIKIHFNDLIGFIRHYGIHRYPEETIQQLEAVLMITDRFDVSMYRTWLPERRLPDWNMVDWLLTVCTSLRLQEDERSQLELDQLNGVDE